MRTISDEIKIMIASKPFIEESMQRGLINYSALAREMIPELEKKLMKSLSEGAVMMAIKRMAAKMPLKNRKELISIRHMMRLTVRSNLIEYSFETSPDMMTLISKLVGLIENQAEEFFTFTRGSHEVTMIFSDSLKPRVDDLFSKEISIAKLDNLASVSIKMPVETVSTPGIHYSILKQLAWNQINIIEVVSTYTELSIIMKLIDIDRAFSILLKYFQS